MTWLAVLLSLGYAAQAGLLVVLGTDATPVLRAFAVGNALLCALLLWSWHFALSVRRPREASRHLALVGVLLFAPAFFLPTLAGWYEEARVAMRTADTELFDVTDEPLYSAVGNVLGVRVGFTLIPPETGYYTVEPVLRPPSGQRERLRETLRRAGVDPALPALRTVRRTIDPRPTAINARRLAADVLDRAGGGLYLEEGVAYGFTFDLLPAYMLHPRDPLPVRNASDLDGWCLALPQSRTGRTVFDSLAERDTPREWRIAVQQTTFGWGEAGEVAGRTLERYSPALFHHGLLQEGVPTCPEEGRA